MALWRRSSSWLTSCSRSSLAGWAPAGVVVVGNEAKVSPEIPVPEEEEEVDEERWSRLLPELLTDIVRRVDAGAERWPQRRDVVACACVCQTWRDAAVSIMRPPLECGRVTFPSSLKQVSPACPTDDELQDRYNFLVETGFDPKDVSHMIKIAPQILNQNIDVLESKIYFFITESGYPLSELVAYPAYLSFTVERSKARFVMYNWLLERGVVTPKLALSTILACSYKYFVEHFVKKHPMAIQVWEDLKKEIASAKNMPCT